MAMSTSYMVRQYPNKKGAPGMRLDAPTDYPERQAGGTRMVAGGSGVRAMPLKQATGTSKLKP